LALLEESARHLDKVNQARLIDDVTRLLKPGTDAASTVQQAYALFQLQAAATILEKPQLLAQINASLGEPDPQWPLTQLLTVVELRAAAGRIDEALPVLKLMVQKPVVAETPNANPRAGMQSTASETATQQYLGVLGLPIVDSQTALLRFGSSATPQWLRAAATALDQWVRDPQLDPDRVLILQIDIAYRLHTAGDAQGADFVIRNISAAIAGPGSYLRSTTDFALAAADEIGRPLDLAAEQRLLVDARLSVERIQEVIARTATEQSATRALELGERAAAYTQNDGLLGALVDIARQAGNDTRAGYWQTARRAASEARRQL
jgi:hypothetical protein